jgi:soluble lytic murein transglycosylase-like protein
MRWLLYVCLAGTALAGEYAVLDNGFRVYAERHERTGDIIKLFTKDGVTEIPAFRIVEFEREEHVPAPPVAPAAEIKAPPPPPLSPRELVRDAATRHGLPPAFVESVAKAESAFRPSVVSPKGAIGVMQLMPETAKVAGVDPYNAGQNIEAGTKLLRELLIKYNGDVVKALSAYNAGPEAVKKYNGMPPYRETVNYVDKVVRDYLKSSAAN